MFKKYSLHQQLIIIFSIIGTVVLLVVFPLLNYNLTKVIDEEMYDLLDQSQKYYYIYQFVPEDDGTVKQVYHFTYNSKEDKIYPAYQMDRSDVTKLVSAFSPTLFSAVRNNEHEVNDKVKFEDDTIYFKIVEMSKGNYLISLVFSDYSKFLISNFNVRVLHLFYASLIIMGLTLFMWVSSLIKSMKKINNYVDDIKNEKSTELVVERDDEIGNIATSLVEMKRELDKQNQIKEEMIHNISHDLKTPISLIKTYAQSIKDDIYPYGDKDSSLNVIIENSDRLEKKVRSLLYLNRLDYISAEEKNDACNMKALIEHIVQQMAPVYPNINIEIQLDNVIFRGKDEYWRICIENILENAMRYVNKDIIITLKQDYLEIYNDGEPIDTTHYDSLFKPYEIGHKGQFGLGLSIVYKTVTMYSYKIDAINKETGVSFVIYKS